MSNQVSINQTTSNVETTNQVWNVTIVNPAAPTVTIVEQVTKVVTVNAPGPQGAAGEYYFIFAASDEDTPLTTGNDKIIFRSPYSLSLTQVPKATLNTASTSGSVVVDIKVEGVSIFNIDKLTIDQNQKTSLTSNTTASLSTTSISNDAEIEVDISNAGVDATGLKITLYYAKS